MAMHCVNDQIFMATNQKDCATSELYLSLEESTCLSVVVRGSHGNTENFSHFTGGFPIKRTAKLKMSKDQAWQCANSTYKL